ncbi:hypothetical protein BJ138DRAFT_23028 [Hygrophoropsis aurantiaca]|uniref:Uncharacterized protein n=1 Tax=Hygrophoropsis aurantiaca TaxID=72124 RepID=A0ACB8ADC4_9AGAM|nr:hypothetical protein BJ138DRAFT_23028 [Hygrophoropsis aurantiaca]
MNLIGHFQIFISFSSTFKFVSIEMGVISVYSEDTCADADSVLMVTVFFCSTGAKFVVLTYIILVHLPVVRPAILHPNVSFGKLWCKQTHFRWQHHNWHKFLSAQKLNIRFTTLSYDDRTLAPSCIRVHL